MKMKQFQSLAMCVLAASVSLGASAQVFDGPIGFVGAGLSFGDVVENRSPDSQVNYMPTWIEGQIAFPIFGDGILGIDGYYSYSDWDATQTNFDTDVPVQELRVALHYSHAVTSDFRLGGFAAYSRNAIFDDDLQKEPYETLYGGLEAQYFVGDTFMFFGQAGLGETFQNPPDQSSADQEGFNDGRFFRAGVTWFPVDSTAFTLEYESASTDNFLNPGGGGGDTGEFWSVGLSGETMLPTDMPLALTYFAQRDRFETSAGSGIALTDLTVGVGLRVLFGADTPRDSWRSGRFLSAPRLPARSVDWLETLD